VSEEVGVCSPSRSFNSQDACALTQHRRTLAGYFSVTSLAAVEPQLNLSDIISSYTRCDLSRLAQSCTV
jgi:hypothetical protein